MSGVPETGSVETIAVVINGEAKTMPADTTLAGVLRALGRDPRTVAIEYNGVIVPRDRFDATLLAADDRLEIVHFVQGG